MLGGIVAIYPKKIVCEYIGVNELLLYERMRHRHPVNYLFYSMQKTKYVGKMEHLNSTYMTIKPFQLG